MPRGNPKGNPNPSPETRFGGPRGNTPGMTSEQRQTELRNAWLATIIQNQMLEAVVASVDGNPASALARIEPSTLKLIKDAQDRGLGTPSASLDVTTNGNDIPGALDLSKLSKPELEVLRKLLGPQ